MQRGTDLVGVDQGDESRAHHNESKAHHHGDESKAHHAPHKELQALHAVREMTWGGDSLHHHGGAYALSQQLGISRPHGLPFCRFSSMPLAFPVCGMRSRDGALLPLMVRSCHFSPVFCHLCGGRRINCRDTIGLRARPCHVPQPAPAPTGQAHIFQFLCRGFI